MNGTVLVQHKSGSNELAIPTKSLVQTLSETSVFKVDPNNVVHSAQVVAGAQLDSLTIITKGLSPGDKVVVDGLQKVRQGDTVIVVKGH